MATGHARHYQETPCNSGAWRRFNDGSKTDRQRRGAARRGCKDRPLATGRPQLRHNLPKYDDRRQHVLSQANRAADAGANASAYAGRSAETRFFRSHNEPLYPAAAFFSTGGAVIAGDIRERTRQAIGLRAAAYAVHGSQSEERRSSIAVRMGRTGAADVLATSLARRIASPMAQKAQTAILRGQLGRTRNSADELLLRRESPELERLRRLLSQAGRVDRRCVCGTGATECESRAHMRTACSLARPARTPWKIFVLRCEDMMCPACDVTLWVCALWWSPTPCVANTNTTMRNSQYGKDQ